MNILIIEDQPIHLKLAHCVLIEGGHVVYDAAAATEGLESIARHRPDIIMLDMDLPDIDGMTLLRKLKADPKTRDIRIVAITAFPARYSEDELRAAGADSYLLKPVDTRQLANQVVTGR